ncbi:ribonuclease H-like protein [Trametopsis cervina]|nr:ribonuclease H-like protein [Trametopsis cervina]
MHSVNYRLQLCIRGDPIVRHAGRRSPALRALVRHFSQSHDLRIDARPGDNPIRRAVVVLQSLFGISRSPQTAPPDLADFPWERKQYSWQKHSPNARLVYIRDRDVMDKELAKLKPGPLGFDLEWKPNREKGVPNHPVALVQLASEDTVLLIHLTAIMKGKKDSFPASLREVLENPSYSKAGVSILPDCKKLWNDHRANVRNCVELGLLARTVDSDRWHGKYAQPIALARLCNAYHGLTLRKGKITCSDWEKTLTREQQEYAANDGHSGLTIYQALHQLLENIQPKPLPSFYSFDVFEGSPYQLSTLSKPTERWEPHNPFYHYDPPVPQRRSKIWKLP